MKKRTNNAKRVAEFYKRKRLAGYIQIKVWVKRHAVESVRAFVREVSP